MTGRAWPLPWAPAQARAGGYRVRRLIEPREIAPLLLEEPAYTAYALAQLEAPNWAGSEWWLAEGPTAWGRPGEAPWALIMHSRGGMGNTLLTLGDAEALAAALALHPGPLSTFVTGQPHHLATLRRSYSLRHERPMLRLAVDGESFSPLEVAPGDSPWRGPCRRLTAQDLEEVNRLYARDREPYYLTSEHLQEGAYYGVEEQGAPKAPGADRARRPTGTLGRLGDLVAVAGTHALAPTYGVGVVGNVFTHPRYRGRGYATIATSAVTAELLGQCRQVVLTVDAANAPALAVYRRLGYREVGQILETGATRRLGSILAGPWRLWTRGRQGIRG